MCIVLLAPGVNPIAFNNYIIISYHIIINKNLSVSVTHTVQECPIFLTKDHKILLWVVSHATRVNST